MPTLQDIINASRDYIATSTELERDEILQQVAALNIGGPSIYEYEELRERLKNTRSAASWRSEVTSIYETAIGATVSETVARSAHYNTAAGESDFALAA
ncbi:MAG: hypothetical protein ABIS36_16250 [Chryseolinea sp.]